MAVVCTTLYISQTAGVLQRRGRSHHQAVLGSGLPAVTAMELLEGGEGEGEGPEGHDDQRHDPRLLAHHGRQAPARDPPHRGGVRLAAAREKECQCCCSLPGLPATVTDGDSNLILHPRTRNVKYSEVIRISAKT